MIRVHSYESLGTYDGPGIRLVVFLQGCNFRCLYCANPDTIDAKGESKETEPEEILRMAVSQKPFYGKKGGVTFSGGEPTFQAGALIPLFKMLKEAGADSAVLKLKSLEAFEKVADGQATTILLPAELQGIASVAETFKAAAGKKAE